jgi:hypothetical protein
MPPLPPGVRAGGPFALSEPGLLEDLARSAELEPLSAHDVACPFEYPDECAAMRALMSAGPAILATRRADDGAVRAAVQASIRSYTSVSGRVRLENQFRYLVASA